MERAIKAKGKLGGSGRGGRRRGVLECQGGYQVVKCRNKKSWRRAWQTIKYRWRTHFVSVSTRGLAGGWRPCPETSETALFRPGDPEGPN
eukprot:758889-Hanusia_phi.AAC.1